MGNMRGVKMGGRFAVKCRERPESAPDGALNEGLSTGLYGYARAHY